MCLNDPDRSSRTREQEDFVDVVANVGGRALEGAKVGAAGGTAGIVAGAALGGAVGAAQTVQADRQKALAKTARLQAQPDVTSSEPGTATIDPRVISKSMNDPGARGTPQEQLTQLISLITKLVAQGASALGPKKSNSFSTGEEYADALSPMEPMLQPEQNTDESQGTQVNRSDRRLQRAAAVRAAKSVAAINSAQAQQQQAARRIAREKKKLAALGVVPARPKSAALQPQVTKDIKLPQPPVASITNPNEPVSMINEPQVVAPETTAGPLSPEVIALLQQLAALTPMLAQLAAPQANMEVDTPPEQQALPDVGDIPAGNQTDEEASAFAIDPALFCAGEEFEEADGGDLLMDDEERSSIFLEDNSDDDESIIEWIADYEGVNDQPEWMDGDLAEVG